MKLLERLKGNKLVKSGANYSLSSTSLSIFNMFISLLNMRWLGPSELGIWQSLCIVNAYIPFLQLGVQSALNVELPVLLGRNEEEKAKSYIANSFCLSAIVTTLIVIIGLIATIIVWTKGLGLKYILGVVAVTGLNVANSVAYHFIARYRSSMSFDKLSQIIRIQLLSAVLCVPLIYLFGFWGLLVFSSVPYLVYALLLYKKSPYNEVRPGINKNDIFYLIKRGLVLMLYGQSSTAIKTFPQWFLLTFGGTIFVGLFSPALAIGSVLNLLPGQLSQFIVPQMGYKYAQTGQAKHLWPYVKKIFIYIPLVIVPISILLFFLLPWLIGTFFPKYVEAITAMQIMCFGFIFSCSSMTVNFLYTIKAFKEATIILLSEAISYLLLPLSVYKLLGADLLVSIAIGVSLTYLIVFVVTFWVMRVTLFKSKYNSMNDYISYGESDKE